MDLKEKQIILSLVSSVIIFCSYSLYIYQNYINGNPGIINNFQFWGKAFLIFIPIAIAAQIIIHIIFAIINKIITNEDVSTKEDERDKLIELKSIRIAHWIFTLGFFISMLTQAVNMQPYIMFILLVLSGFMSSIISEMFRFYYYRKGF